MQFIWGKILAGEIEKPGTYSIRTLELLRNLSQAEAEIFTKFAKLSVHAGKDVFLLNPAGDYLEKEHSIKYGDILLLNEVGLLASNDTLRYTVELHNFEGEHSLILGDLAVFVEKGSATEMLSLPVLAFTRPAKELLKLIQFSPEQKYVDKLCTALKQSNFSVSKAKVLQKNADGSFVFMRPKEPVV
jgi:hypothetical protein